MKNRTWFAFLSSAVLGTAILTIPAGAETLRRGTVSYTHLTLPTTPYV